MPFYEKDVHSESISAAVPIGVDDTVGVSTAKWYVAIVNSRHEKAVADKLRKINVECYVPTQKEMHVWRNGRRKLVDRIVIPSVVFVKCTERTRQDIVNLPYINRFMVNRTASSNGQNRNVAIINEIEIEKLKFMLGQAERPVEFVSAMFRINDNVRVVRGNLRGLEGEIRRNSDGSHILAVSLSLLGGATVFIEPQDVEKISKSTEH